MPTDMPTFGTTHTVMAHTGLTYRRARQLIALAGFAQRKVVPMAAVLAEAQRCSREGLPVAKRYTPHGSTK